MPDDNIPSQKYRDTGIPGYFVTLSIVDNFCKNPTMRIASNHANHAVLSPILFPITE